MENCDLKHLGLLELSAKEYLAVKGGMVWKIITLTSIAIYVYDHWECIKAGVNYELSK